MQSNHFLSRGESVRINYNVQTGNVVLLHASGLQIYYVQNNEWKEFNLNESVSVPLPYEGLIRIQALAAGKNSATLVNVDEQGNEQDRLEIRADVCRVSLKNDSDRDGDVDHADSGNEAWVWGSGQRGAVLLVNNDLDISEIDPALGHFSEWSKFRVEDTLLDTFPENVYLSLTATEGSAARFTVYAQDIDGSYVRILGKDPKGEQAPLVSSEPLSIKGGEYFIEAHEYPGANFEGLITLELLLVQGRSVLATDSMVFRVAPWIMTPNTLAAERVFTCRIADGGNSNERFLHGLATALDTMGVPLTVIEPQDHMGDRWIQDEIEFGYVQGSSHILPVVMDSPRDRGLDDFPERALLGPDFGHFQVGGSRPNSLDSFGNLEVSPPVTVNGRYYPFGRIVFGGKKYGDYSEANRQMMPQLRKFLYAQKVQAPFEIYTDWLSVGHADEIICFVPANNDVGFEVLVASPQRAKAILERLKITGYGSSTLFEGRMRGEPGSGISAEIAVSDLLDDTGFWLDNMEYQNHMDSNIEILKRNLGVDDRHIIQIPVLFHPAGTNRTVAYFPDMVNHLVIDNTSIVPKPYGPVIEGLCAFEQAFRDAVPERSVVFIDDWYSYHEMLGEVHCGTNIQRKPFRNRLWWEYKPDGGYDI
ncbi:MAG: protein-arginine deiminase family protein [Gammaproteobacteria bacterium]|nr:protein-arginine deiminase family protein [Gammaproteobacteria bacterium]MDH5800120.1 protein-arginine deiminase family protein [Gammaproteobacteria bacterium]